MTRIIKIGHHVLTRFPSLRTLRGYCLAVARRTCKLRRTGISLGLENTALALEAICSLKLLPYISHERGRPSEVQLMVIARDLQIMVKSK